MSSDKPNTEDLVQAPRASPGAPGVAGSSGGQSGKGVPAPGERPWSEPATGRKDVKDTDIGSVFVSNYPPFSFWVPGQLAAYDTAINAAPTDGSALGMYLHIPFCRKRCKFCYFRVYTDKNSDEVQRYTDALVDELALYADRAAIAGRTLRFVYFGGGTPSYISVRHLTELVQRLRSLKSWEDVEEVTFECEPGTLSYSKLEAIREIGVTRLSLGIEHFNDHILELNGRAHVSKEIHRVMPWIAEMGFDQVNIDLIAGMVGETWETWRETVREAIEYAPDSVTVYQLELPFNTRFTRQYFEGRLVAPIADWPTKRAWQQYAWERLADAGYQVSSAYTMVKNPACAFGYRDSLWHGADMLGIGVSSFGYMSGVHVQNTADWLRYLSDIDKQRLPTQRAYATSADERLTREVILQLKTGSIKTAYFVDKFNVDVLERFRSAFSLLEKNEMLRIDGGQVELTPQGLLQVDTLLHEFYASEHRNARYT